MIFAWLQDLHFAARSLRRRPLFACLAIATIALGLGANLLIFAVVDAVVLRPLPYPEPDRIVRVWAEHWLLKEEFPLLRRQTRAYSALAAYFGYGGTTLSGDGGAQYVPTAQVSAAILDVLGVAPALGRGFDDVETRPGGPRVALLSHGLWQRRFAGDPGVIGRSVLLGGAPTTVVGVLPRSLHFPNNRAQIWLPMVFDPADEIDYSRSRYLQLVGRLRAGWTPARAQAEARTVATRVAEQLGQSEVYGRNAVVVPLHETLVGEVRPALLTLLGAVLCLLLIACVNVTNLLLVRGDARTREVALRSALGASRLQLARLVLSESLLIAGAGGVAAALTVALGFGILRAALPVDLPRLHEVTLDGRLLLFGAGLTLFAGVIVGLVPALRFKESGGGLQAGLRESPAGGGPRGWLRPALVVAQVALAVGLVASAGLLTRSLWQLTRVDSGLETARLLSFWPILPADRYADEDLARQAGQRILDEVRAIPGVLGAGGINMVPVADRGYIGRLYRAESPEDPEAPIVNWRMVTPDYFETAGVALLRGRRLSERDRAGTPDVALVNQTLASQVWPGEDALGKRFRMPLEGADWIRVVGIVGDVHQHGLENDVRPEVYRPVRQSRRPAGTALLVRTGVDPEALFPLIREAVASVDRDAAVSSLQTMDQVIHRSTAQPRLVAGLVGALAGLALLLGAVGTYGVLSADVGRRTREIGIRVALGATRGDVVRLVLRDGVGLVLSGLVLGLPLAFGASRLIRSQLFQVAPGDPLTYASVALVLAAVGALAAFVPARRAARLNPMVAIRHE